MSAPTPHWALEDDELIRLVDDALLSIPQENAALVRELLSRFQMLLSEQDDFK